MFLIKRIFLVLGLVCMFPRAQWSAPRLCFPALGIGCLIFHAWNWIHIFPRLIPGTCNFVLGAHGRQTRTQSPPIYSFSRWNMGRRSMHAKPFGKEEEKVTAIFFRPSLDAPRTQHTLPINHSADKRSDWVRVYNQGMFSRAWYWMHVLPSLGPVSRNSR